MAATCVHQIAWNTPHLSQVDICNHCSGFQTSSWAWFSKSSKFPENISGSVVCICGFGELNLRLSLDETPVLVAVTILNEKISLAGTQVCCCWGQGVNTCICTWQSSGSYFLPKFFTFSGPANLLVHTACILVTWNFLFWDRQAAKETYIRVVLMFFNHVGLLI